MKAAARAKRNWRTALLGLFIGLVAVELGLRATGYIFSSLQDRSRLFRLGTAAPPYKILCLGESTTAPVLPHDISWPRQLALLLNAADPAHPADVINMGVTGTNSGFILGKLPYYLDTYKPDLVVAMIGVNDDQWYGILRTRPTAGGHLQRILFSLKIVALLRYADHEIVSRLRRRFARALAARKPTAPLPKETQECWRFRRQPLFLSRDPKALRDAEKACSRAMALFPDLPEPYVVLGHADRALGRIAEAQSMDERATALLTIDHEPYEQLAHAYEAQGQFGKAEAVLKKELEINQPNSDGPYRELANFYFRRGLTDKTNQIYDEIISRDTSGSSAQVETFSIHPSTGAAAQGASGSNSAVTAHHYRQIRDLILGRGIALIAMQYPRNDVQSLMSMLDHSPRVVFVDNQDNFEKALAKGRYTDYFSDRFRDSWGHATEAGNGLIARNLAPYVRAARAGRSGALRSPSD